MNSTIDSGSLRNFLTLSYDELEMMNLEMKHLYEQGKSESFFEKKVTKYLESEKRIKAVTLAFCDLEGKLLMLDYDKNFFLGAYDNLTFDGSSVNGFATLDNADLRFLPDFSSFRWLPADIFGPGKVMMFAYVGDQDGSLYPADFRGRLKMLTEEMKKKHGYSVFNVAPEIEGFLAAGEDAEQNYHSMNGFELATRGGYFNDLPQGPMRRFIDTVAEVLRATGFESEKDHPEVAPSTFEINFKYSEVRRTADNIMLYKLICRQVAKLMGMTASFLPKPVVGINGCGMHSNMSLSKGGKNIFYDKKGVGNLSDTAVRFAHGILYRAPELCLSIVSSINGYRALDPNFEAPNEIKMSPVDRGSMIRIPLGNEKSARIEVRSVRPDVNPYLAYFVLLSAGLEGIATSKKQYAEMEKTVSKKRFLWGNIYDAIGACKKSEFMKNVMGSENHEKYVDLKKETSYRSPRDMGEKIKTGEVIYHHEITNQELWESF